MSTLFDLKALNGKHLDEAKEILLRVDPSNTNIRVVEPNTFQTMDYVATRINLKIEKDVVVDAWIG